MNIPSMVSMSASFVDVNIIPAHNQHSWIVPTNTVLSVTQLTPSECAKKLQGKGNHMVLFNPSKESASFYELELGLPAGNSVSILCADKPDAMRVRISQLKDVEKGEAEKNELHNYQLVSFGEQILQVPSFSQLGIEPE